MARAIWNGVLTFGLVSVPVQLFTATEDHRVHFRQFQRGTSNRIRYRRVNEATGREVDYNDIVKGYDLGGGDYVIVEPEELDEIAPGKSRMIDIRGFVDLDQVEPVYFDRTYYLAPNGEEYTKVYELLRTALYEANKAGIATFVMRRKQHLVALRAQEDVLVLHTLHWADEVRDPHQELPVLPEHTETRGQELDTARQLIDALSTDWHPEDYHDTYSERVHELIDAKAKGQQIISEAGPPEATNVIDLMQALKRSVENARQARPQSRGGDKTPSVPAAGKEARKARTDAGSDDRDDLVRMSKHELYQRARERNIAGRSKMNRGQLIDALAKTESIAAAS
ncbi:non-homologous end joining protein Ku [Nonomuraea sp. SYSU D8015]|uniref:non-homologous end joining protein Ku n=1 Tax=Nonomuraea sp. SYSU D8015 TaxID=2593644 RepID=UPI0016607ADF|nr:Ku protein [Nonomuraea sp. SYSU D8015]